MKKMTRTVSAAVILVLTVAAVSLVVYAYLMSRIERPNNFRIDEGSIEITEAFTEPTLLSMQNAFTKLVAIQNTGSSDQYVRVFLDFSDSSVRDQSTLVYVKEDRTLEASWDAFLDNLPDGWSYVPEDDPQDAVLGGFFYYTEILAPGESTPSLIEGIKTDFGDGDSDQIKDFEIIVYSESVQTVETGSGQVYAPPEDPEDPEADQTPWKTAWKQFLTREP